MSNLVIFPWLDREEVRSVYEELFSKDVSKQKHALGRISVWKCRSMNRLPAAVESTSALISAQIARTELSENDVSVFGIDVHLRNLYSMAIIRFVNHITEKGQQGTFARPVHVVASRLGVPEWIVELRHEATHGSLPSLNELSAAMLWALEWLRENFWEPQTSETFGVSSLKSAAGDILKDSLVTYMQRRFQEISNGESTSNKQLLTNIEHMLQQLGSCACPILVEDGYLILTEEQLVALNYSYNDLRSNGILLLPSKVLDFWNKVIHLLVKTNLIADLLLHMASVVTEVSSLRNFLLCCWLYTLIWHNKSNKTKSKKAQSNLFQSPIEIPYTCLLEKCLHLKNKDADSLLNLMIDNADLTLAQKQNLRHLLSVCKSTNNGVKSLSKAMCINDLHEENKSWRKCLEPVDWSNLPIGLLTNQTLDYTCLELGSCQTNLYCDWNKRSEEDEEMDEQAADSMDSTESENACSNRLLSNDTEHSAYKSKFQWDEKMKEIISNSIQLF